MTAYQGRKEVKLHGHQEGGSKEGSKEDSKEEEIRF